MLRICITLYAISALCGAYAQSPRTRFEASQGTQTCTYAEGIAYWQTLVRMYPSVRLTSQGNTDSGLPLHTVILDSDYDFEPMATRKRGKTVCLINNAIHPGEPDGVEACQMWIRDLAAALARRDTAVRNMLARTVIVVIPFYNVGGVLNRNSRSRVNQDGPEEHGFRGNARHLDLNRDFVKADSDEAKTFAQIFHRWSPDVMVDTHVTNGADYQHTMTYLATMPAKLGGELGEYLRTHLIPLMEMKMQEANFPMCPYVNAFDTTPEQGYAQFYETPRYSTGYAALFGTVGFITETHMLKPYAERVRATLAFLQSLVALLRTEGAQLRALREARLREIRTQAHFVIDWQLNKADYRLIEFMGYEPEYITSRITGNQRLQYRRDRPFTRSIPYYYRYDPKTTIAKPRAYLIPQAWREAITRLQMNGVKLHRLKTDLKVSLEVYYIEDFKTPQNPFEGHYLHSQVKIRPEMQEVLMRAGDYVAYTDQIANRYLIETLEPEAPDSFFNWNFFDSILQQKEWFSDYVFEDIAAKIIAERPEIGAALAQRRAEDAEFAKNQFAQLYFIYRQAAYLEPEFRRYPVFRLVQDVPLPLAD